MDGTQCNRCLAGTMKLIDSKTLGDVRIEHLKCESCGREDSRDVRVEPAVDDRLTPPTTLPPAPSEPPANKAAAPKRPKPPGRKRPPAAPKGNPIRPKTRRAAE